MGVRVSAIVSAYFSEPFLEGRLMNLLEQDEAPEVIVVAMKGSGEERILRDTGLIDRVLALWTEGVPTIYNAWNAAIREASGKYLTNANTDDRLEPGGLKLLADALDEHPQYAVAYGNQSIYEEMDGEAIGSYEWKEGGLLTLLGGCFLGPMPVWRAALHEKYGYFDGDMHVAGDYEFWLRLAAGGEKFFHVRQVVGRYLKRKKQAEKREPIRTIWETARARARYRKEEGC